MDRDDLLVRLGMALAIGFLIGLERGWKDREEKEGQRTAGLRTYTLIALLGGIFGALSKDQNFLLLAFGFIVVSGALAAFFWREGVSEEELSKARNVLLAAHWRRLKTIDGKAEALGVEDVIGGDYHRVFSTAERYRRVTRKQIQTLAARIFDERNRTVGVLLPTEEAP